MNQLALGTRILRTAQRIAAPIVAEEDKAPREVWHGWDAHRSHAIALLSPKEQATQASWLRALPSRRELERLTKAGCTPILHGYAHAVDTLRHASDTPKSVHETLDQLHRMLGVAAATARMHNPF